MRVLKISIKHLKNGLVIYCDDKRILEGIEKSLCMAVIETNEKTLMRCNFD